MKRLLLLLIFLALPLSGFAQTQFLYQSTATQIQIGATLIASGLMTTAGAIPGGFSMWIVKAADSGAPTVTAWTPTNSGGGTHDCYAVANSDEWTCEIPAADVGTLGRADICWRYPSAYTMCDRYTVVPLPGVTGYPPVDAKYYNGTATTGTGLATILKNVSSQQLGIWFKTAAGANATGISTANITCTISKDFGAPATTNDTTEAEVGNGLYYIDLTQAETNANWIAVNCHDASGVGLDYSSLVTTQH